ncbi:Na+/H+ antiporter NhaC family protein [Fusobacterium sp. THCT1E2]
MNTKTEGEKKNYGGWAFIPLVVFLIIYLGGGMFFSARGVASPFNQLPRHAALLIGVIIAFAMNRKMKLDDKINIFTTTSGESGVMMMALIFLLAGAFAGVAKGMGGVDSVVNLGLTFVPKQFLVPGLFVISAFISTAMGTSTGTLVAVAPIALGISEKVGLNPAITLAAVLGGAMFGDNLSVISDTTIAATRGVGCEMKDKFRMNFLIAIPAAIATIIAFTIVGGAGQIEGELSYNLIKVVPYLAVLIAAVAGINVFTVLIGGILFAGAVGFVTSSMTFVTFFQSVAKGMDGMMNVTIMAILIRGLIGLIKEYGGIEWLVQKLTGNIKTRKGAEYSIAVLVSVLVFCLVNNTIAIIIASPIAKQVGEKFKIAPKRTASLLDIFSCVILCLAPHAGGMLLITSMASVSPIEIISFSFYQVFLGICTIITIQFGLMKTKEEKEADLLEKQAQLR